LLKTIVLCNCSEAQHLFEIDMFFKILKSLFLINLRHHCLKYSLKTKQKNGIDLKLLNDSVYSHSIDIIMINFLTLSVTLLHLSCRNCPLGLA